MTESISELDVRNLDSGKRLGEILRVCDALAPGETCLFRTDPDSRGLFRSLQQARSEDLDWNIVEVGHDCFRVLVRRREVQGPRSVSEYLGNDHRRLDGLLATVKQLAEDGAFAAAGQRFSEFECGLGWHIDVEEEILFPAFENLTGIVAGPTRVMRGEHQEIRQLMQSIRIALGGEDLKGTDRAIRGLVDVLSVHNRKEEHVLYPTTDQAAGGDYGRNELVKRLQSYMPNA